MQNTLQGTNEGRSIISQSKRNHLGRAKQFKGKINLWPFLSFLWGSFLFLSFHVRATSLFSGECNCNIALINWQCPRCPVCSNGLSAIVSRMPQLPTTKWMLHCCLATVCCNNTCNISSPNDTRMHRTTVGLSCFLVRESTLLYRENSRLDTFVSSLHNDLRRTSGYSPCVWVLLGEQNYSLRHCFWQ